MAMHTTSSQLLQLVWKKRLTKVGSAGHSKLLGVPIQLGYHLDSSLLKYKAIRKRCKIQGLWNCEVVA